MHNGVFSTLEEVMDFYNRGGGVGLGIKIPNQTLPFDKLDLSESERNEIIAFIESLDSSEARAVLSGWFGVKCVSTSLGFHRRSGYKVIQL